MDCNLFFNFFDVYIDQINSHLTVREEQKSLLIMQHIYNYTVLAHIYINSLHQYKYNKIETNMNNKIPKHCINIKNASIFFLT